MTAPNITNLDPTIVDPDATYFVSFETLANSSVLQHEAILTVNGWQYATWYTGTAGTLIVARRQLPAGGWELAELPHTLSTLDAHNIISLGVSLVDGCLHIACDTHVSPLYYTRSVPGLLDDPAAVVWDADAFAPFTTTLDGVTIGADITYPTFATTPEGWLQLVYRTGSSGSGINRLAEWDGTAWTLLGAFSDSAGTYTANGGTSTSRSLYLNGLTYDTNGRAHVFGIWREASITVLCNPGAPLTNHDYVYVYSDDRCRTWRNMVGSVVATTGSANLLKVTDSGIVAHVIPTNYAAMNMETQTVSSDGRPFSAQSYVPGRLSTCVTSEQARIDGARCVLWYLKPGGVWAFSEVKIGGADTSIKWNSLAGRSQIVLDSGDNAYMVLPGLRIVTASKAANYADWALRYDGFLFAGAFGEVCVDRGRVTADGVLTVMYQQMVSGGRSALRIVDFLLG